MSNLPSPEVWRALQALRERRRLLAAQRAAAATGEAARQRHEAAARQAELAAGRTQRAAHCAAAQAPDEGGGLPVSRLQQAGPWAGALARRIVDAGVRAERACAQALADECAATQAGRDAAHAAARCEVARQALTAARDGRAAARERREEQQAEGLAQARWHGALPRDGR